MMIRRQRLKSSLLLLLLAILFACPAAFVVPHGYRRRPGGKATPEASFQKIHPPIQLPKLPPSVRFLRPIDDNNDDGTAETRLNVSFSDTIHELLLEERMKMDNKEGDGGSDGAVSSPNNGAISNDDSSEVMQQVEGVEADDWTAPFQPLEEQSRPPKPRPTTAERLGIKLPAETAHSAPTTHSLQVAAATLRDSLGPVLAPLFVDNGLQRNVPGSTVLGAAVSTGVLAASTHAPLVLPVMALLAGAYGAILPGPVGYVLRLVGRLVAVLGQDVVLPLCRLAMGRLDVDSWSTWVAEQISQALDPPPAPSTVTMDSRTFFIDVIGNDTTQAPPHTDFASGYGIKHHPSSNHAVSDQVLRLSPSPPLDPPPVAMMKKQQQQENIVPMPPINDAIMPLSPDLFAPEDLEMWQHLEIAPPSDDGNSDVAAQVSKSLPDPTNANVQASSVQSPVAPRNSSTNVDPMTPPTQQDEVVAMPDADMSENLAENDDQDSEVPATTDPLLMADSAAATEAASAAPVDDDAVDLDKADGLDIISDDASLAEARSSPPEIAETLTDLPSGNVGTAAVDDTTSSAFTNAALVEHVGAMADDSTKGADSALSASNEHIPLAATDAALAAFLAQSESTVAAADVLHTDDETVESADNAGAAPDQETENVADMEGLGDIDSIEQSESELETTLLPTVSSKEIPEPESLMTMPAEATVERVDHMAPAPADRAGDDDIGNVQPVDFDKEPEGDVGDLIDTATLNVIETSLDDADLTANLAATVTDTQSENVVMPVDTAAVKEVGTGTSIADTLDVLDGIDEAEADKVTMPLKAADVHKANDDERSRVVNEATVKFDAVATTGAVEQAGGELETTQQPTVSLEEASEPESFMNMSAEATVEGTDNMAPADMQEDNDIGNVQPVDIDSDLEGGVGNLVDTATLDAVDTELDDADLAANPATENIVMPVDPAAVADDATDTPIAHPLDVLDNKIGEAEATDDVTIPLEASIDNRAIVDKSSTVVQEEATETFDTTGTTDVVEQAEAELDAARLAPVSLEDVLEAKSRMNKLAEARIEKTDQVTLSDMEVKEDIGNVQPERDSGNPMDTATVDTVETSMDDTDPTTHLAATVAEAESENVAIPLDPAAVKEDATDTPTADTLDVRDGIDEAEATEDVTPPLEAAVDNIANDNKSSTSMQEGVAAFDAAAATEDIEQPDAELKGAPLPAVLMDEASEPEPADGTCNTGQALDTEKSEAEAGDFEQSSNTDLRGESVLREAVPVDPMVSAIPLEMLPPGARPAPARSQPAAGKEDSEALDLSKDQSSVKADKSATAAPVASDPLNLNLWKTSATDAPMIFPTRGENLKRDDTSTDVLNAKDNVVASGAANIDSPNGATEVAPVRNVFVYPSRPRPGYLSIPKPTAQHEKLQRHLLEARLALHARGTEQRPFLDVPDKEAQQDDLSTMAGLLKTRTDIKARRPEQALSKNEAELAQHEASRSESVRMVQAIVLNEKGNEHRRKAREPEIAAVKGETQASEALADTDESIPMTSPRKVSNELFQRRLLEARLQSQSQSATTSDEKSNTAKVTPGGRDTPGMPNHDAPFAFMVAPEEMGGKYPEAALAAEADQSVSVDDSLTFPRRGALQPYNFDPLSRGGSRPKWGVEYRGWGSL